jgi:biopolymer transport protein TolR
MAFDVGGSGSAVAPRINVTPLVDVVLVLLIIFMVVTPLLTKKFWLHVPKNEEKVEEDQLAADKKPNNVVLSFHKGGTIKINNEPVGRAELGDKLRRILAAKGDRLIFFDAEDDSDYGQAVEVMDLARGAGASAIAVLSETVLQQKGAN